MMTDCSNQRTRKPTDALSGVTWILSTFPTCNESHNKRSVEFILDCV